MRTKTFNEIYNRNFGLIYNIAAGVFSWIFYFFLQDQLVSSAKVVIFFPDETKADLLTAAFIILAIIFEMMGISLKAGRIRHILTSPEEYSEFYNKSEKTYTSDLIFLHFLTIFATRIMLSALIGYILFALLGYMNLAVFGSLLFIAKDIIFLKVVTTDIGKPKKQESAKGFNLVSNILLMFSGFVFLSIVWDAFGQRFNETLCTLTNWQGFGDFTLGIILLTFFYFLFFHPTRIAFIFEEIEFVNSKKEERRMMFNYFLSILFAIAPWLI